MPKAAKPHPTGGWRAYKKIAGKEYQFYSRDKSEADKKQALLEATSKLKPKRVFAPCGRFVGVRVRLRVRADRRPAIYVRITGPKGTKGLRAEWRYQGSFEENWARMRDKWKALHELMPADVAGYAQEIKQAKRLYLQDIIALERDNRLNGVAHPVAHATGPSVPRRLRPG